jgi:NAD-dependent SIR2 family protein deacetylase
VTGAGIPAAGGVATARALAALYDALHEALTRP